MIRFEAICLTAVLALLACIPATAKAGLRRMAEAKVGNCLMNSRCRQGEIVACYLDSEQWCRDHQMERTCGEGGPTGACKP